MVLLPISNKILDKREAICYTKDMSLSLSSLQSLNLTPTEIELYELLLKLGEVPMAKIVQEAKRKRPTIYKALYTLEKRGLATKRDLQKKIHFKPEPPTKLLELANRQYKSAEQTRNDLQHLLPILSSLYVQSVERPLVNIYEGIEGLKSIYKEILADGISGYTVLQIEDVNSDLEEFLTTTFLRGRLRKHMHLKALVLEGKSAKEFVSRDAQEFRISRIVPKNLFPFQHEVTVWSDKVAFIHYKKDEPLIGMVIKHPDFAKTMKAFFDLAWIGAESYKLDK